LHLKPTTAACFALLLLHFLPALLQYMVLDLKRFVPLIHYHCLTVFCIALLPLSVCTPGCLQYMVLDLKRFVPRRQLQEGLLWVAEQLPGVVEAADMTQVRRETHELCFTHNGSLRCCVSCCVLLSIDCLYCRCKSVCRVDEAAILWWAVCTD
jgi:hypothetical protein